MPVPPFAIVLPGDIVRKHEAEVELLLRVGAITNAVLTLARTMPDLPVKNARERRDAQAVSSMVAGYLYVLSKELETRHDGLWWRLAKEGCENGRELPSHIATFDEVYALLKFGSLFSYWCGFIRDTVAFHSDKRPFLTYIREPGQAEYVIQSLNGDASMDIVFDASVDALLQATMAKVPATFMEDVSRVAGVLPYLVEAMVIGFLDRVGEDPNKYVKRLVEHEAQP